MSKDLDLKSGTKPVAKKLTSVSLANNFQAFGLNCSTLSATMAGLHLEWNGDVVVVWHEAYAGQEKWIFPGNITVMSWCDK